MSMKDIIETYFKPYVTEENDGIFIYVPDSNGHIDFERRFEESDAIKLGGGTIYDDGEELVFQPTAEIGSALLTNRQTAFWGYYSFRNNQYVQYKVTVNKPSDLTFGILGPKTGGAFPELLIDQYTTSSTTLRFYADEGLYMFSVRNNSVHEVHVTGELFA